jgi:hypothetical protein
VEAREELWGSCRVGIKKELTLLAVVVTLLCRAIPILGRSIHTSEVWHNIFPGNLAFDFLPSVVILASFRF